MKFSLRSLVAALLTVSASGLATAQVAVGATDAMQTPFASLSAGGRGPNLEIANAIVQALAAEASLKGSKLTVAPEEKVILLTGVTPTLAQMTRAVQIATGHAGQGKVINAIITEQVVMGPA